MRDSRNHPRNRFSCLLRVGSGRFCDLCPPTYGSAPSSSASIRSRQAIAPAAACASRSRSRPAPHRSRIPTYLDASVPPALLEHGREAGREPAGRRVLKRDAFRRDRREASPGRSTTRFPPARAAAAVGCPAARTPPGSLIRAVTPLPPRCSAPSWAVSPSLRLHIQ